MIEQTRVVRVFDLLTHQRLQASTSTTSGSYSGLQGLIGYTETGGTFEGMVSAQTSEAGKSRIGLDARSRARANLEFIGGSAARTYNAANVSVGVNYQLSYGVTLHSEIEMSRVLTAGASDPNRAGIKIGATIKF